MQNKPYNSKQCKNYDPIKKALNVCLALFRIVQFILRNKIKFMNIENILSLLRKGEMTNLKVMGRRLFYLFFTYFNKKTKKILFF